MKSQLIGKDPDAGKDWGQEEKGTAEDETDSIDNSMDVTLSKLRETVKDSETWHIAVNRVTEKGHDLVTEQQQFRG